MSEPEGGAAAPCHPFWSVIVPTYRREQVLCETIRRLLGLSYPNYELIVIDQTPAHEAATERFIHACEEERAGRFRWRFVARVNLPHARNVGARMARGDYLLYCDDDIIPPVDLIQRHMRNLTQAGVGAVTGGVYMKRRKRPPNAAVLRNFCAGRGGNRDSPCIIRPSGRLIERWNHALPRCATDSLRGCNMSAPRQLAFDVGLFDEGFIGNAHREETDFSLRIRRRGYRIIYDPDAAVVHLSHPTGGSRASLAANRSRYFSELHYNHAYFHAKNFPQRYLLWFLYKGFGLVFVKLGIVQRQPQWIIASLQGLWRGYWAGRRKRGDRAAAID